MNLKVGVAHIGYFDDATAAFANGDSTESTCRVGEKGLRPASAQLRPFGLMWGDSLRGPDLGENQPTGHWLAKRGPNAVE